MKPRIVVAVTGASGAIYAQRLLRLLAAEPIETHLVVSPYGVRLFADELDIAKFSVEAVVGAAASSIRLHNYHDVGSSLASGSFLTQGMIVCPTSSNTLGAIAAGLGDNLITRAAHCHLKERRRLVLVTREMPLSHIELQNMLRISEAGGIICPAAPGFYLKPKSLDEVVDFVVGKALDLVGVAHRLNTRWSGAAPAAE